MTKTNQHKSLYIICNNIFFIGLFCGALLLINASMSHESTITSGDKAVDIAKHSRDMVENSGLEIKESSNNLFREFAIHSGKLQTLIDTRKKLAAAGFLGDDTDGKIRRCNLNARILKEIGSLKTTFDNNISPLLEALDHYDDTIAVSLSGSQATRSINSNYELLLKHYLQVEQKKFDDTAQAARNILQQYRDNEQSNIKRRLLRKYNLLKHHLKRIIQRRNLHEARLKVAEANQRISAAVREKIRRQGSEISDHFRDMLTSAYTAFAKIVPVVDMEKSGIPDDLANLGFSNLDRMGSTLKLMDSSISKLNNVLDSMVHDVTSGLDQIHDINDKSITSNTVSVANEIKWLNKQRLSWNKKKL